MHQVKPIHVLFLCTGNSARSILAEAILNREGNGELRGFSAGSHPQGAVHPHTLAVLQAHGIDIDGCRSKNWDEFAADSSEAMDIVITVCDNAAGEVCPIWPANPITAHWSIEDPAAAEGTDEQVREAFEKAYQTLSDCIVSLVCVLCADSSAKQLRDRLNQLNPRP